MKIPKYISIFHRETQKENKEKQKNKDLIDGNNTYKILCAETIRANNLALEKYEIKKPDYQLVRREYNCLNTIHLKPRRYEKRGNIWVSKKPYSETARIMFTGDISCFQGQIKEAEKRKYDFFPEFKEIESIFSQTDLVVGNLETKIFPQAPYRSEKIVSEQNFYCNAPLEFLDAIQKAGIDCLTTANNHDLDTGAVGLGETIDNIHDFGIIQTGTFNTKEKHYELFDICGFRVAIIAFATCHNNKLCNLTQEGGRFLINHYSRNTAKELITNAREDGAEVVICCVHWGTENNIVQSKQQEKIALQLAECGCDCIIGSHPHVLQPFTYIQMNERSIPVFYSLGNFLSHNVTGSKSRSAIACLDLTRSEGNIKINCSYIPIYIAESYKGNGFVVIPIREFTLRTRNQKIKKVISDILGEKIDITKGITYPDISGEKKAQEKETNHSIDITGLEYPIAVESNFLFSLSKDFACLAGIHSNSTICTVPDQILGYPVIKAVDSAFENNSTLIKINMNKSLKKISRKMFKGCINLQGLQIGRGVSEIEEEAFTGCTNLSAAILNNNVKTVGKRAFSNCPALVTIKIPRQVEQISDDAFSGSKNVVIYCEENSYAEQYAIKMKIPYVRMLLSIPESELLEKSVSELLENSKKMDAISKIETNASSPYSTSVFIQTITTGSRDYPYSVKKTCELLGQPLKNNPIFPSEEVDFSKIYEGGITQIISEMNRLNVKIQAEELKKHYRNFEKKMKGQKCFEFNPTNCIVWFFDWILFALDRGYTFNDYFDFEFYKKDIAERDTFLGQGYRRSILQIANKDKVERHKFSDKALFNKTFSEFVKRDWVDTTNCSFQEFAHFIANNESFFAKPVKGTGGAGAVVIRSDSDTPENLYEYCRKNELIVEQVVQQHAELAKFNASTTNTIRIYSLLCADETVQITMAAARFGRAGKCADNFHQGGCGVVVDIKSGTLITDGIDRAHMAVVYHPDSHERFKGFQFPEWNKVIAAVEKAAKIVPTVRHVGWDITVTDNGEVEFIEGNSFSNIDLPQIPDQRGRRPVYEPYLKELAAKDNICFPQSESWYR